VLLAVSVAVTRSLRLPPWPLRTAVGALLLVRLAAVLLSAVMALALLTGPVSRPPGPCG
jgi:hypothetical protein